MRLKVTPEQEGWWHLNLSWRAMPLLKTNPTMMVAGKIAFSVGVELRSWNVNVWLAAIVSFA
jgi:hypothetical protein